MLCGWVSGGGWDVRARSTWVCGGPSCGVWPGQCVRAETHGQWYEIFIFCGNVTFTFGWPLAQRLTGPGRQSLHGRTAEK